MRRSEAARGRARAVSAGHPVVAPAGPRAQGCRAALAAAVLALAAVALALLPAPPARAQTAQTVQPDWPLVPVGVNPGQSFRLLFVTSTGGDARSPDIAVYNRFVQVRAATNTHLAGFSGAFRALISTAAVDARVNTATTGTGVLVYWLGGAKVADDYADLYDGSWDSRAGKTESGGGPAALFIWTGSNADGTRHATYPAGALTVRIGWLGRGSTISESRVRNRPPARWSRRFAFYALSPVITVAAADSVPPAKPTGLAAAAGDGTVTLRWTDPSDSSIVRYQYRRDSAAWTDIPGSVAATSSYTVRNLANGATYTFRLRALDAANTGAASDPVTATPAGSSLGVPLAPSGLSAGADGRAGIYLSWAPPAADAARRAAVNGYGIEWSADGSAPWTALATVRGAATRSYKHGGLAGGTTRHYRVKATSSAGDGPFSNAASARAGALRPPVWPNSLTARPHGANAIELRWMTSTSVETTPPRAPVTGYRIEVSPNGSDSWTVLTTVRVPPELDWASYTHTGLPEGATRYYRVKATSVAGDSLFAVMGLSPSGATVVSATTEDSTLGLMSTVTVTPGVGRLTVSWNAVRRPYRYSYEKTTRYTVKWWRTSDPSNGGERGTGALSDTLAGLTPGEEYTVEVTPGFAGSSAYHGEPFARVTGTPLAAPALSVADARAAEGGAALGFAVTLSAAASRTVTVEWATADGTARAGEDYAGASGTLAFGPGETAKTVAVAVHADGTQEGEETVRLTLRNPSGATLADGEATGAIADVAPPALTAGIVEAPSEHGGTGTFRVWIGFSAPVTVSAKGLRGALRVMRGEVKRVWRVRGRGDLWAVRIAPRSHRAVTLRLPATTDCAGDGAICTADGRWLGSALSLTVDGPPALSVADAKAKEGRDATIDFAVRLSRAAPGEVTVRYATRDGTATAGEDYTRTSGRLTFAAGETAKTVPVGLLDDAVDEGKETFALVLSRARGAVIADGEAVGTIRNADPMPQVWLARFGRTVASQAVDAVTARLEAGGASHVTLGGQRLGLDAPEAGAAARAEAAAGVEAVAAALGAGTDGERDRGAWTRGGAPAAESRTMTGRELLLGSSFHLGAGGEAGDAAFAAWGRVAHGSFDADADGVRLDGAVTTGLVGADVASGRWLAGAAVSVSEGDGTFGLSGDAASESAFGSGTVESTLTSVLPYSRYAVSERVSVWGLAGWGTGTLTLTAKGAETEKRYRTDLSMTLGALGARGALLTPEEADGFALALKGDAFFVRTESDAVRSGEGSLAAAQGDASRLRLALDASRAFDMGGGATLTPSLELGVRHDGGDAETGFGADIGGGLAYSGHGLTAALHGRGLLSHEAGGMRERGFSGSLAWDPRPDTDRGMSLSLTQTVGGSASGGADALLGRDTLAGLAANDSGAAARRLELKLGYGFSAFGDRFTAAPELGLGLSDTGREVRLGWRLGLVPGGAGSLELRLEARRREPANDPGSGSGAGSPEHAVGLRLDARF